MPQKRPLASPATPAATSSGNAEHPAQEPVRSPLAWMVYTILFAIAIPWYWPAGFTGPVYFGFPLWTLVTLAAVFLAACWTAYVVFHYWHESPGETDDR